MEKSLSKKLKTLTEKLNEKMEQKLGIEEFLKKEKITKKDLFDCANSLPSLKDVLSYVGENIPESKKDEYVNRFVEFLKDRKIHKEYEIMYTDVHNEKEEIAIALLALRNIFGKQIISNKRDSIDDLIDNEIRGFAKKDSEILAVCRSGSEISPIYYFFKDAGLSSKEFYSNFSKFSREIYKKFDKIISGMCFCSGLEEIKKQKLFSNCIYEKSKPKEK